MICGLSTFPWKHMLTLIKQDLPQRAESLPCSHRSLCTGKAERPKTFAFCSRQPVQGYRLTSHRSLFQESVSHAFFFQTLHKLIELKLHGFMPSYIACLSFRPFSTVT